MVNCLSAVGTSREPDVAPHPPVPATGKGEGKVNIPLKIKYLKVHRIWDQDILIIHHSEDKCNSETIWGQEVKVLQ